MKLLITSAGSALARSLATQLRNEHVVSLTERFPIDNLANFAHCALDHDAATNQVVRGMDALVHVAEPLPGDNDLAQLDLFTRCTYNLYLAAVAEGVQRVVLLSTLNLMTAYPTEYTVGERWRPLPGTATPVLGRHLAEFVSREFAREYKLAVVVLRVGKVVRSEAVVGQPFDPLWVDERDVAQAVHRALISDTGRWGIFHILSAAPGARFSSALAQRALGYTPNFDFHSHQ